MNFSLRYKFLDDYFNGSPNTIFINLQSMITYDVNQSYITIMNIILHYLNHDKNTNIIFVNNYEKCNALTANNDKNYSKLIKGIENIFNTFESLFGKKYYIKTYLNIDYFINIFCEIFNIQRFIYFYRNNSEISLYKDYNNILLLKAKKYSKKKEFVDFYAQKDNIIDYVKELNIRRILPKNVDSKALSTIFRNRLLKKDIIDNMLYLRFSKYDRFKNVATDSQVNIILNELIVRSKTNSNASLVEVIRDNKSTSKRLDIYKENIDDKAKRDNLSTYTSEFKGATNLLNSLKMKRDTKYVEETIMELLKQFLDFYEIPDIREVYQKLTHLLENKI